MTDTSAQAPLAPTTAPPFDQPVHWTPARLFRTPKATLVDLLRITALVLLANLLVFYREAGLGLALFLLVLMILIAEAYRARFTTRCIAGFVAAGLAIVLVVESANVISVPLAIAAISALAFLAANKWLTSPMAMARRFLFVHVVGSLLAPIDMLRIRPPTAISTGDPLSFARATKAPIFYVLIGAVFLLLFSDANPWLAAFFVWLDPLRWVTLPRIETILLWGVTASLLWPLLRLRSLNSPQANLTVGPERPAMIAGLFAQNPLLFLVTFNGIFFLQTSADLLGLWPSVILGTPISDLLPDGVTYSNFAREGTYSLLIAAGIAMAIIVALLNYPNKTALAGTAKPLLYLWLLQIAALSASAALRMVLYVDAYGLTHLRLFTFIGLALVAAGLSLTAWRIHAERTNIWLIQRCVASSIVTVYVCGAINIDAVIAANNIDRAVATQVNDRRSKLDVYYLCRLGSEALPELNRAIHLSQNTNTLSLSKSQRRHLNHCYRRLHQRMENRQTDFREWSWRASRILAASPVQEQWSAKPNGFSTKNGLNGQQYELKNDPAFTTDAPEKTERASPREETREKPARGRERHEQDTYR